tara:strand:- start:296 stop:466 length:171 start_codon:yes stop_codon:yes gene_type:complete
MTLLIQYQGLGDEALIDAARERLHSPTTTAFDVNLIQALVERLEDAIAELGDVTRD